MGKSLIIKGADFSANGIAESVALDITQAVADAGKWLTQRRVTSLDGQGPQADTKKCCIQHFDITTVTGYANYTKLRITFADTLNYVFGWGYPYVRVTGIETTASDFAWTTDNHVGEILIGTKTILNVNVRIGSGSEVMAADTTIQSCMKIELLP